MSRPKSKLKKLEIDNQDQVQIHISRNWLVFMQEEIQIKFIHPPTPPVKYRIGDTHFLSYIYVKRKYLYVYSLQIFYIFLQIVFYLVSAFSVLTAMLLLANLLFIKFHKSEQKIPKKYPLSHCSETKISCAR